MKLLMLRQNTDNWEIYILYLKIKQLTLQKMAYLNMPKDEFSNLVII
jgi:hypothetical protein